MVDMIINNNVDMGEFQILNVVVQNLASAPTTSYEGRLVYITSDHTLRYWDGTEWAVVSDRAYAEAIVAAIDLTDLAVANSLTGAAGDGSYTLTLRTREGTARTVTISAASGTSAGVMTAEQATKLAGIAGGAQVNVIEAINVNGSAVEITGKTVDLSIPTAVSELTNDAGYITASVTGLENYYTKSETYTKAEVMAIIGDLSEIHIETVESLPESGSANTFYLVPKSSSGSRNVYDEYLWINEAWELVGDTEIDLSEYLEKNAPIAAGTHTKITYDANGLVTAGSDLAASDIPDLSATYIPLTQKGAASGVASLDSTTKVPVAQLPTANAADNVAVLGEAASDGQYLTWDEDSESWMPTTLPVKKPYQGTVTGDGSTTDFPLTHGLGYIGVPAVYDSTGAQVIVATTMDSSTVTLHFGRAPASGVTYTVVVA